MIIDRFSKYSIVIVHFYCNSVIHSFPRCWFVLANGVDKRITLNLKWLCDFDVANGAHNGAFIALSDRLKCSSVHITHTWELVEIFCSQALDSQQRKMFFLGNLHSSSFRFAGSFLALNHSFNVSSSITHISMPHHLNHLYSSPIHFPKSSQPEQTNHCMQITIEYKSICSIRKCLHQLACSTYALV